ncbi:hypothetical protein LSH36_249g03089 [Paralvinella palmiformis]|uniref:Major facilitator superfamily associated domain-containing protein n=1 Tax=Paralvinella palmiformis TaxID=53620 RepID=A0AAD9JKY4_9ANNE|nr:hypothetical protein LSH36_249g03089 [Paralvinella palmiformis]
MSKIQFHSYAFHFLFAAAKGCLLPYLTVYFRVLGLTATQVGMIMGVGAFVTMISSATCAGCAVRCNKRRLLLVSSIFTLFVSYTLLMLLPPVNDEGALQFCNNKVSVILNPENQSIFETMNINDDVITKFKPTVMMSTVSPFKAIEDVHINTTTATTPIITTVSTTPVATETPNQTQTGIYKHLSKENISLLDELGISIDDLKGLSRDDINQIIKEVSNEMKQTQTETRNPTNQRRRGHARIGRHRIGRSVGDTDEKSSDRNDSHVDAAEHDDNASSDMTNTTLMTTMWQKIQQLQEQLNQLRSQVFVAVLGIIIIASLFGSPADRVSDDMWFDFLDSSDMVEKYGQHRSWAALGLLIFPIIPAAIVENTPCLLFGTILNIKVHFFAFASLMLGTFALTFTYPIFRERRKIHRKMLLSRGFKILFTDCHAVLYTLTVIVVGMIDALLSNFLFWRVQDLGGTELVMGASVVASACGQIVMYIMYRWLICKVSHGGAVVLGLLILSASLIFYSFAWMPWLIVAGEFFHSISTTLIWNAFMLYPDFRLNPFVMDRSALTVATALYFGFGVAGGSLLSGYTTDMFGLKIVFQGGCVIILAWSILLAISLKCVVKKAKIRYAKLLQDDDSQSDDESVSFDEDDWLETALKHNK